MEDFTMPILRIECVFLAIRGLVLRLLQLALL